MKTAKFNKSMIFRAAWSAVRALGLSLSEALKRAWSIAKTATAPAAEPVQLAAATAAILAGTPTRFSLLMQSPIKGTNGVIKETTGTVIIGKTYEAAMTEALGSPYVSKPRPWGIFSPSTGLLEHKGATYLPVIFEAAKSVYLDEFYQVVGPGHRDWAIVQKEIEKAQNDSSPVKYRTPTLTNIKRLRKIAEIL